MDFEKDLEDLYFDTKHGKMHYKHHSGKGKPIIFLHGFASNVRSWNRLVSHLPENSDLYLIDLLGHGDSDAPHIEYSLQMHYETLVDFVHSNIDTDPVLFGHSYGGWVAAYYASKNKIDRLVLEDSAGLREFAEERHKNDPGYRERMLKDALMLNPREYVLRSMLHSDNTRSFLDPQTLSKISCKCMIIWGSEDKIVNTKYSAQFNKGIKNSVLKIIEGAKHTPHYSRPEEISQLLEDFL